MTGPGDPSVIEMIKDPVRYFGWRRLFGVWRGEVVAVDDPEKRGRVRVRVAAWHPKGAPANLYPWAEPMFTLAGNGNGWFFVPSVGDRVDVMFLRGNREFPFYMGSYYLQSQGVSQLPPEFRDTDAYPLRQGIQTAAGHKVILSDDPNNAEIILKTAGGRLISIRDNDQAGSSEKKGVTIDAGSGYSIKINEEDNEVTIDCPGDVKVDAGGDAVVKAAGTVQLGDATVDPTDGCVTGKSVCHFTGAPHADVSSKVLAKKS